MAVRAGGMTGLAIVPFRPELAPAFRRLNLDWIERLFAVEDADRAVLDNPLRTIIAPGGQIFFAVEAGKAVGTVALIRIADRPYELAKMAVAESHQRRGIGELLGAPRRSRSRAVPAQIPCFWRRTAAWPARYGCTSGWAFVSGPIRIARNTPGPMCTWSCQSAARGVKYPFFDGSQVMHKSKLAGFIVDCRTGDLQAAAAFWSAALGMETRVLPGKEGDTYVRLVDPEDRLHVEVQSVDHESRVHLDIEADDVEAEVRRLEQLGAKRVAQVKTWWVMQAPTGQKFCVVRPQSRDFGARAHRWD